MSQTLIEYLEQLTRALDANEVSELFGINKDTVYRFAAEETLPSFRLGSVLRFDPKALAQCLRDKQFHPKRGIPHEIADWLKEQALYRGGPCFLPQLLCKALKFLDYDWLRTAERVSRDKALDCFHASLVDDVKTAIAELAIPEQRFLLAEIKTGKCDEPISQHRDLLTEPEPGDDEVME
jgi:predicted DNA-binding transcriptional regulator AlpA